MLYPLIKTLHIVFVTSWFAGLFYLPRLFVNHAMSQDLAVHAQLVLMERKLFRFMTGLAHLAIGFGVWLWLGVGFRGGWLHAKLGLVVALVVYHGYCRVLMRELAEGRNRRSHVWFRWFNEIPVVLLLAIVALVVYKPF
jgi:putative membrane protein